MFQRCPRYFIAARDAHIGIPQSGVAASGHLAFFSRNLILALSPETSRDPATCNQRSRKARSRIAFA
jgi:hypothetical protein